MTTLPLAECFPLSCAGLTRASRLGMHRTRLSGMAGTSPAMTSKSAEIMPMTALLLAECFPLSCAGLTRASRLGMQRARLSGMAGTSPAMTSKSAEIMP